MSRIVSFTSRSRLLASAAVLSLIAGGAIGEGVLPHPASAAATATSADLHGQSLQGPSIPSFASLIEKVKPAVVAVKVKIVDDATDQGALPPQIQRFFQRFGEQRPAPQVMLGEGSGFFISPDGYVVTNNHVVDNSKSVTVTMDDGTVLDAKVVGKDPKTDIALLKVDRPGDYPYVSFATEQPKVGDWVVAIGNPYGLGGTVTAGIISAEGRDIGDGAYDRFLQIDAPINKGNSGGPTFNLEGQVVGMNTAIYSPSGGSVGIGFDIPASTVSRVVGDLEQGGFVRRGYLGVKIQPVGPDIAESLNLKTAVGAIVDEAMPGTPAAEAGLKPGDVITKLNGEKVRDAGDLTRRIGAMKPGEKVQLTVLRQGSEKTYDVTLAPQQAEKTASVPTSETPSSSATLGLQLAPRGDAAGHGVEIAAVDPNGEGALKGLKPGDVILDVAGKAVSTPDEVKSDIAQAKDNGAKAVLMRVETADGARFVAFAFPKA